MEMVVVTILGILMVATPFIITEITESERIKLGRIRNKLEKEQVEEGEELISVVDEINLSKGTVEMVNGGILKFSDLKEVPEIGGKLRYIKTFGYNITSLRKSAERLEETEYLNIRVVNSN